MSSLVLLGEQPSAAELAALVTRLGGSADGASLASLASAEATLPQLLDAAIFKPKAWVTALPDDDFTTTMTLSFAVLSHVRSGAAAASATAQLASLLTASPAQRPHLMIKTLTSLINVVAALPTIAPAQRFQLLMQMLEFALAATPAAAAAAAASPAVPAAATPSPAAIVLQPLPSLHAQINAWKLSPADATALLLISYKLSLRVGDSPQLQQPRALKAKGDDSAADVAIVYSLGEQPTLQQEYLFALLKSLDAAAPATQKEKQFADLAVTAAVASASNGLAGTIHTLDPVNVYQLAAVQALGAAHPALTLLRVLVDADLPGWLAFEKGAGAAFLKEHAALLDTDLLLRKIRTLALCALAVESQARNENTLSYAVVQQKLQLPAKDNEAVEAAVIDAVMAGRIDAKMDQEQETLYVKRVVGGVSVSLYTGPDSKAAWAALGGRLATWRENLHQVLATLSSAGHPQAHGGEDVAEE